MKKSYYAVIPANVRYDKSLTPHAKLLYGEITALCNEKGYCWASNRYFADLYEVSRTSISNWIKCLIDNGYIVTQLYHIKDGKKVQERRIYLSEAVPDLSSEPKETLQEDLDSPSNEVEETLQEELKGTLQENLKDNNTPSIDTSINKYNDNERPPKKSKKQIEEERLKADFQRFWDIYPRKVNKPRALSVWEKKKPNKELTEIIIEAVIAQDKTLWQGQDQKYTPHPATWLNGERWEDEIIKSPPPQNNRRTSAQSERERIKDPSEYDHPTNANAYARAWFEKQQALAAQGGEDHA